MNATKTLIGMAAAMALSTGTTVLAQVGGPDPETISPPVPADSLRQDQNRGTTGQPGNHTGMATAQKGNSDQSVHEQLQQIKASPDQAIQKLFILEQGMMNQWEIELSDAVASKTQDQQVKQLAQMTKQDHQKAQDRLRQVAQKHNVTLSDQLPAMKQQKLAVLKQMPADKLDKCFLSMQKSSHAAAITSLSDHKQMFSDQPRDNAQPQAGNAQNPGANAQNPGGMAQNDASKAGKEELRAYIDETLPTVKQHANRIVEVAQSKGLDGEITTIASTGSNAEAGTSADRDSAAKGANSMPPKARDGALRGQPGDQMTGEQRE